MCVGGSTTPTFNELRMWTETLKIGLMAIFSATWSASDWPVSPYIFVTEAQIEAQQAPEDRAKKEL